MFSASSGDVEDRQQLRDKWLQEVFDSAEVDSQGQIDEFEVVKLMKKLNTGLTTHKIQQKLKVKGIFKSFI